MARQRIGGRRTLRAAVIAATVVALTLPALLAGCALFGGAESSPIIGPSTGPSGSGVPTPSPTAVPVFVADGSASDNLAVFEWTGQSAVDSDGDVRSQTLVDAMIDAGFTAAQLEATSDTTAAGFAADSIFVAARFGSECVIGQARGTSFTAIVAPTLTNERCLVGFSNRVDE